MPRPNMRIKVGRMPHDIRIWGRIVEVRSTKQFVRHLLSTTSYSRVYHAFPQNSTIFSNPFYFSPRSPYNEVRKCNLFSYLKEFAMKKSIVFILLTSLFTGAFSACQPTDATTSAPQSSESAPVSPEPSEPAPTAEETPTPASTEEASSDPSSSPDESEALSETDSFSVNTENSLLFHL